MIIFLAFKITAIIICVLVVIYSCIQIFRTNKVYTIRTKWVLSMDSKWDKYSFDEMLKIDRSTWFGLKVPKEEDFK